MSAHAGSDDSKMSVFLLGFLVGILVCLGAAGAFFMVWQQHERAMSPSERHKRETREELFRREEQVKRLRAEKALEATTKALQEARKELERAKKPKE
jgi:hypothetical protein